MKLPALLLLLLPFPALAQSESYEKRPEVRSFIDFLAANIVPALAGAPEGEGRGGMRKSAAS